MPTVQTSRPRLLAAAALAALVAGAAACASTLEGLAPFPCADDSTCPEGWTCSLGTCVSESMPGADAGVDRACETHSDCDQGAKLGACVGLVNGGSACAVKCNVKQDSKCIGSDCKLVLSGVRGTYNSLVAACTPFGYTPEGGSCFGVDSCAKGLTCAHDKFDPSSYYCTEICSPGRTTCTMTNKRCTYGMAGFPADWGLCFEQ